MGSCRILNTNNWLLISSLISYLPFLCDQPDSTSGKTYASGREVWDLNPEPNKSLIRCQRLAIGYKLKVWALAQVVVPTPDTQKGISKRNENLVIFVFRLVGKVIFAYSLIKSTLKFVIFTLRSHNVLMF